jgi:CBS domain-containing protein
MEPTARDIMSTDVLTVSADSTLEDALKLIVGQRITGVPVIDQDGKVVGICSDYDIIRQFSKAKRKEPKLFRKKIRFSKTIESVAVDTPLQEIVNRFVDQRFRRLPVVDGAGRLVGIITRRDMMKVFFYQAKLGT